MVVLTVDLALVVDLMPPHVDCAVPVEVFGASSVYVLSSCG